MSRLTIESITADLVYPLRQSILRPDKPYDFSSYSADHDRTTLHLGAYFSGKLIGIASIYLESAAGSSDTDWWRLRDMGVVESMRRQAVGSALLDSCQSHIVANRGKLFWCYARESAVPFYLSQGFQVADNSIQLEGFGQRFFMSRAITKDREIW